MRVSHRTEGKAENTGSKRTGARASPGVQIAGAKEHSLQDTVVSGELWPFSRTFKIEVPMLCF